MRLYFLITLKRKLEELLMAPFVRQGRRWARRHPLPADYDAFFFFPIYGLGGAEKVNAAVINCVPDKKVFIFFTRRSPEDSMLPLFSRPHVTYRDISRRTDNKKRYWDNFFWRGVCAEYIECQQKPPVVFNGQCNFGYKLFPHLRRDIRTIELIHNANRHYARITFPYVPFIHERIFITGKLQEDHAAFYDAIGIPARYKQRMRTIYNAIEPVEGSGPRTAYPERLRVYYAGRGGPQKRIPLVVAAIRAARARNLPIDFHLAGNFEEELPADIGTLCTYHGEIRGDAAMHRFHQAMDVLMLTSAFEGFPLVIMEAMINGVVSVATAVDGVPEHIHSGENGLLIQNAADGEGVVRQLVDHLNYLCAHRDHLQRMSEAGYTYARTTFSAAKFCRSYRSVMGFD